MQLTKDFTLEELTRTDTGVVNIPGEAEKEKLLCLATYILQPIRERWGGLIVTSGFRCPALNAQVGGVAASQHVKGEAADFIAHDASLDDVFKWIVNGSGSRFGQCIRESKSGRQWIHISLPRLDGGNHEALVYDGAGYKPYAG